MDIDLEIEALAFPEQSPDPFQSIDMPYAPPLAPTPPPLTRSGRPRRNYQLPRRFRDIPPDPSPCVPDPLVENPPTRLPRILLVVRDHLVTTANAFGILRDYPRRPTRDPDAALSIPSFEGLLEGAHNRRLMKLLYRTAEWHGLAKMRIHTESSLVLLEELTTEFGQLMRQFRDLTCSQFATTELPKEVLARNRRQAQKQTPPARTTTQPAQTTTSLLNIDLISVPDSASVEHQEQGSSPTPDVNGEVV